MSTNVLSGLNTLNINRPAPDAAPLLVAAWYQAKARVLDQLAREGSDLARKQARIARRHAVALAQRDLFGEVA